MLDSDSLRSVLKQIFGVEDKYLVPLNSDWFVPTIDPEDKIGTWIGYRILSKKPTVRTYQSGTYKVKFIKLRLRFSFVGPEAEKLADQTLLWDDRTDVVNAFEAAEAQINYESREEFSYPVRNSGYNDMQAWIVDISAQTTYQVDTKQVPWIGG